MVIIVDDFDILFLRLRAVEVFSDVDRPEIVHVLIDEFRYRNFGKITVGLVLDEAHCEYVAERGRDKSGFLLTKSFNRVVKSTYGSWLINSMVSNSRKYLYGINPTSTFQRGFIVSIR